MDQNYAAMKYEVENAHCSLESTILLHDVLNTDLLAVAYSMNNVDNLLNLTTSVIFKTDANKKDFESFKCFLDYEVITSFIQVRHDRTGNTMRLFSTGDAGEIVILFYKELEFVPGTVNTTVDPVSEIHGVVKWGQDIVLLPNSLVNYHHWLNTGEFLTTCPQNTSFAHLLH